jgi:3-oxoacyl-[acyl-carrier-protein] synthase-3
MQFSVPDIRIAEVETCDFSMMASHGSETLLRAAYPGDWERYLESEVSRGMIETLGVQSRYLTQVPGRPPAPERLTSSDLARSAVHRMRKGHPDELARLDALIYVSTSNPNPCNSQAALLAEELEIRPSCLDLKAGCSSGVFGLAQAALLLNAGCERVLVVMAENLSQLTPPDDLRMLLTVGDGAACVLMERRPGPGFLGVMHGSEPGFASTMTVPTPFPPASPDAVYQYQLQGANEAAAFLRDKWRSLFRDSLGSVGLEPADIAHWFFHQTHGAQVDELLEDLDMKPSTTVRVVDRHGNMGTPTFAVAMARRFRTMRPGQKYLLQAVGGGISWCAIVAEHR